MTLRSVWTVFAKEVLELSRDHRSMIMTIVVPIVLYPLLVIGFSMLTVTQLEKLQNKSYTLAVPAGAPMDWVLPEVTKGDAWKTITLPAESLADSTYLRAGIVGGKFQIAMLQDGPPPDLEAALPQYPKLRVYYDQANEESGTARDKLTDRLRVVSDSLAVLRLKTVGLIEQDMHPLRPETHDLATAEKKGAFAFGRVLAMLLIIMAIMGAFYPALDLMAGEKERGTLETLLTTPISRMEIAFGKYFAIFLFSMITAILNLGSMAMTFSYGMGFLNVQDKLNFSLDPRALLLILLILVPIAGLFSGLFLALSSFARSYKEGQNYLTPVFIIAELPAMLPILPGVKLTGVLLFVPLANASVLFRDMLLGDYSFWSVMVVFVTNFAVAVGAVLWSTKLLQSEDVLFTESPWTSLWVAVRRGVKREAPFASEAWALFILSLLMLWYIGAPLQAGDPLQGLLVTELLCVALPPLIWAWRSQLDVRSTFGIYWPRAANWFTVPVLAISGFVLVTWLNNGIASWIPGYESYANLLKNTVSKLGGDSWWGSLLVVALLPAVCEELLFRGFLLPAFRRKSSDWEAIILSGLLFGLFHVDPYRLAGATALGIVLGWLRVRTGSLAVPILYHFVNNATAVLLMLFAERMPGLLGEEGDLGVSAMIAAGAIFLVALLVTAGINRQRPVVSAEAP